jgi:ribosomal protein S18 acetylase RimI-like enzyme
LETCQVYCEDTLKTYDLALAWSWEHDKDFVARLEAACAQRGLSLLHVTPSRLPDVLARLLCGDLIFHALYDRAGDADDAYLPLIKWATAQNVARINDYATARYAWDKATMHLEFITAGLHTPHTIILPPYAQQPNIPTPNLAPLGTQFSIKPAHGGGGTGVVNHATGWSQVQAARVKYPTDKYLLQEWITPALLEGKRAWFRPIYACGQVFVNWWNDQTHLYTPVTLQEETALSLGIIRTMVHTIARICKLEIFSTEIALSNDGRWLSVDYVNDPIDLRLQSKAPESVPDDVVAGVADSLANCVARRVQPSVRLAVPTDLPTVTALLAEMGRPLLSTPQVFERYITDPDYALLVVELNGRVVGLLSGVFRPRLGRAQLELWLADLCVTASARRYGAGRALVKRAIELARARNCFRIILESAHHRDGAHRLFREAGFEERGLYFALTLDGKT